MSVVIDGTSGVTTPGVVNTAGETIATTLAVTGASTLTGNVGIGRTSSTYKLEIAANNNGVALYGSAGTASSVYLAANGNTPGTTSLDILQGGDNQGYVYNRANAALNFGTNNTTQAAITASGLLQFNSGYGSVATAYGCRAWVNFNGTGTVAIRASGNVSSITDNGLGDYTVNFTTAMVDANYSLCGTAGIGTAGNYIWGICPQADIANFATGSIRFKVKEGSSSGTVDSSLISVSIFR